MPGSVAEVGRDEDPALAVELGLEGAGEDARSKRRPAGSVDGQRRGPWPRGRPSRLRVWIARQPSIQRDRTAPPSSCARKRAGMASRPLSSTVCRYSPVNTDSCHSLP